MEEDIQNDIPIEPAEPIPADEAEDEEEEEDVKPIVPPLNKEDELDEPVADEI